MRNQILFVMVMLSCFVSSACGQILYEVIDLGLGQANSINDNGQIVGMRYEIPGRYDVHNAILLDSTGGGSNIILGEGNAISNNNNGQITGYSHFSGDVHAFLYSNGQ